MSVPHSSTPWAVSSKTPTAITDAEGNFIVSVIGSNAQSLATATHIVRCVNDWHENHADAENERYAAER